MKSNTPTKTPKSSKRSEAQAGETATTRASAVNQKKAADGRHRPSRQETRRLRIEAKANWSGATDTVWFLVIFGAAFLLRLLYLNQVESIPLFYVPAGDGRGYDEWAQRIAAGDWLGAGVFYQAPLYPYFLAVLQTLLGRDLWFIRLVQIALGALSCGLIFLAGRSWISRQAGIAAGLMLACYAPAIFFDGLIEKSILDLFLLSMFLTLIGKICEKPPWPLWLGAGAVVGVLGLSRENALVLAAVVPVWIALQFRAESLAARLRWGALFIAGFLLVLFPVGLRNFVVGGEFKLTTSQFGPNLFIGNNPAADGTYGSVRKLIGEAQLEGSDAKRLAERATGRNLSAGEVSDYWLGKSLDYIGSHPVDWLSLMVKKWLMVWNTREIEDSDDFYIYRQWSWLLNILGWFANFGVLAPLAAAGLWLTREQWRRLRLLYVMILTLAASVALFYIFGRYRYPLVPMLALFAGAGLAQFASLFTQRTRRQLPAAAGILLTSAVIVNWPLYGSSGPSAAGYNNLSNAYYKQGNVKEAIQTALKAIELEPDYGVAHYNLGNLYAGQGRIELAQRHFEEALRLYPNYAEVHANLGQLIAERGDLADGIRYFQKAIDLNPSLGRAHLNLGVALAKQGRTEEAVRPLREAVRLAPDSVEYHYYLGSVYAELGRFDEAARAFNDALLVRSDFAPAHQSLAQVLSLQGKKEEARQHYQEALRLMKQTRGPATGVQ
jgi:tetratricopeptide (TPR) repeat protein